jgi:hypothetical protein
MNNDYDFKFHLILLNISMFQRKWYLTVNSILNHTPVF